MIIPTILPYSKDELVIQLSQLEKFFNRVSVDIIDTSFAETKTLQADAMEDVNWLGLEVDVQLMVDEPERYMTSLPLSKISRVISQVEHLKDKQIFLDTCRLHGVKAGLGLDLMTSESYITQEEYAQFETVLLMAVPAGKAGQTFDVQVLEKIQVLRARGYRGNIIVDGGMNSETIPLALDAGANQFCVNSAIWESENPALAFQQLEKLLPNDTTTT